MDTNYLFISSKPDDELLALLQKGDEKAFTAIYARYHKLLYVIAYRYLKDEDATQDAIQQIFLKLWESHTFLNIQVSLRNYLGTMLKNYLLNEIRNNHIAMEKHYEMVQTAVQYEDEIQEKLEKKEMSEQLYQAIGKLPRQKRTICLYKLRQGLSNQEIAERMQISIPTVKTHYTQAIKLLKEHFDKLQGWFLITIFIN